jgi:hypothetical protein
MLPGRRGPGGLTEEAVAKSDEGLKVLRPRRLTSLAAQWRCCKE